MNDIKLIFASVFVMALGLLAACDGGDSDSGPAGCPAVSERVELFSEDGLKIVGCYYPPAVSTGITPNLIMMHKLGGSKSEMAPLASSLNSVGYGVLNLDLRGHGESVDRGISAGLDPISYKTMEDRDFHWTWLDLRVAVNSIVDRGFRADKIALIGSDIGANIAAIYANGKSRYADDYEYSEIANIALISPVDHPALEIIDSEVLRGYHPRLFIAVGGQDFESIQVSSYIIGSLATALDIVVAGSKVHGAKLLYANPEAKDALIDYLKGVLPLPSS